MGMVQMILGGITLYLLSVGLAAHAVRAWYGWEIVHQPEWRSESSGDVCGQGKVECPGCRTRETMWIAASFWPAVLGFEVLRGLVRTVCFLATVAGPTVYTGEAE